MCIFSDVSWGGNNELVCFGVHVNVKIKFWPPFTVNPDCSSSFFYYNWFLWLAPPHTTSHSLSFVFHKLVSRKGTSRLNVYFFRCKLGGNNDIVCYMCCVSSECVGSAMKPANAMHEWVNKYLCACVRGRLYICAYVPARICASPRFLHRSRLHSCTRHVGPNCQV